MASTHAPFPMFVSESRGSAESSPSKPPTANNVSDHADPPSANGSTSSASSAVSPLPATPSSASPSPSAAAAQVRSEASPSTAAAAAGAAASVPSSSSSSASKGPLPPPPPPPLNLCIVINICHYLTPLAKLIIAAQPLDPQSLACSAAAAATTTTLSTAGESEREAFLALQLILSVLDSGRNEPINVFPFLDKFCRYIGVSFNDFEDMDIFLVWDYVVKLITMVIPPLREVFLGRLSPSLATSLSALALDEQAWHALTTRCVHAQFSQSVQSVDEFVRLSLSSLEKDYYSDLDLYTHTNKTSLESIKNFNSVLLSRAPEILAFTIESPHLPSALRFLDALSKNPSKAKPPSTIKFPASFSLSSASSLSSLTAADEGKDEQQDDSAECTVYELTAVVTLEGPHTDLAQAYYRYVSATPAPGEEMQWYKGSGATHDLVENAKAIEKNYFNVSDPAAKRVHPRLLIYTKQNIAQSLAALQSSVTKAGQLRCKGDALFDAAETPEHYDEAKALYEDAIAVDESLRQELQGRLHSLEQIERNQKATSYENQADLSLGKRRFKEACDLYKLAMRSAVPNHPIYHRIREKEDYMMRIISLEIANHLTEKGEDCLKNGQYAQSRENFAQALKLNPAYVHLQSIIAGIDKLITAQSSAQKVSEANAAMKLGRYKYANQLYLEAVQLVPERESSLRPVLDSLVVLMQGEDALNRQRQGLLALEDKKYPQAIALITEAIALLPRESVMEHAFFLCDRAQVYFEMKDYSTAIEDCHAALALRPDLAIALLRLGSAQFELSLFDEALAAYERAMRSDPSLSDQVKVKVRQVNTAKEVQQRKERERERERIKEEEQRRLEEKRARIERERREKAERQREEQSEKAERALMKEEEKKTRVYAQKVAEQERESANNAIAGDAVGNNTGNDRIEHNSSQKESSSSSSAAGASAAANGKESKAAKAKVKAEKDAQRLAERQAEKERARAEKERERERVKAEKAAKERAKELEKEEELRRQREFAAEMERAASVLREAEREKEADRERARLERERIMAEKEKSRAEKERRNAEKQEKKRREEKEKEEMLQREKEKKKTLAGVLSATSVDPDFPTLSAAATSSSPATVGASPAGLGAFASPLLASPMSSLGSSSVKSKTPATSSTLHASTPSAQREGQKWASLLAPTSSNTSSVAQSTSATTMSVTDEDRESKAIAGSGALSQKTVSILKKPSSTNSLVSMASPSVVSPPGIVSTSSTALSAGSLSTSVSTSASVSVPVSAAERERDAERERELAGLLEAEDDFPSLLAHTHAQTTQSAQAPPLLHLGSASPLRLSAWDALASHSASSQAAAPLSHGQSETAFPSLSGLSLSPGLPSLSGLAADEQTGSLFEGLGISGGLGSGLGNLGSGLGLSGGLGLSAGLGAPGFSRGQSLSLFGAGESLSLSEPLFGGSSTSSGVHGGVTSGVASSGNDLFSLDFSLGGADPFLGLRERESERERERESTSRLDKILGLSVSSTMSPLSDPFAKFSTSSHTAGAASTSSGVAVEGLWADPSPLSAHAPPFTLPLSSTLSLPLRANSNGNSSKLQSLAELRKSLEEVRVTDSVVFSLLPRCAVLGVSLYHFAFDSAAGDWAENALLLPDSMSSTLSLSDLAVRARCEVRLEPCNVPLKPGSSQVSGNKLLVCAKRSTNAVMEALLQLYDRERETQPWSSAVLGETESDANTALLLDNLLGGGPLNVSSKKERTTSVVTAAAVAVSAASSLPQKRFLEIPVELIGLVIGHGGRKIKDLGAESGAKIQFRTSRHSEREGKPGVLEIIGSAEQVDKALSLVGDLLQSVGKEYKELTHSQANMVAQSLTPSKANK